MSSRNLIEAIANTCGTSDAGLAAVARAPEAKPARGPQNVRRMSREPLEVEDGNPLAATNIVTATPTMFAVQIIGKDRYRIPVLRLNARAMLGSQSKTLVAEFRHFCGASRAGLMRSPTDRYLWVIVDFQDVNLLDGAGLAGLVQMFKVCLQEDFALVIVSLTGTVLELFELSRLDEVLLCYPNVDAALRELR